MSTDHKPTAATCISCAIILGIFYLLGKGQEKHLQQFTMAAVGDSAVAIMNTSTGEVNVITAQNGGLVRLHEPRVVFDKPGFTPDKEDPYNRIGKRP